NHLRRNGSKEPGQKRISSGFTTEPADRTGRRLHFTLVGAFPGRRFCLALLAYRRSLSAPIIVFRPASRLSLLVRGGRSHAARHHLVLASRHSTPVAAARAAHEGHPATRTARFRCF